MANPVKLKKLDDGILSITIASDEDPYLVYEPLIEAFKKAGEDPDTIAVLLEGGENHFCSGGSRSYLLSLTAQKVHDVNKRLLSSLLSIPVPTVALMSGHAIGGGFLLGLWCDFPILAEESMYGVNMMALGFTPGLGATILMPELCGRIFSNRILFTGRLFTGTELRSVGSPLAQSIVTKSAVQNLARTIVEDLGEVFRDALIRLKRDLSEDRMHSMELALKKEASMHEGLLGSPKMIEMIDKNFGKS